MYPPQTVRLAERLLELCRARGLHLVTAESMTGGLVAGALTEVPGASDVVAGGYVVYTAEQKHRALGIDAELLASQGTVGGEVTRLLAEAACEQAAAGLALAVTGYASDGPGVPEGAVGTTDVAVALPGAETVHEEDHFAGDRGEVRRQAVHAVLALAVRVLEDQR